MLRTSKVLKKKKKFLVKKKGRKEPQEPEPPSHLGPSPLFPPARRAAPGRSEAQSSPHTPSLFFLFQSLSHGSHLAGPRSSSSSAQTPRECNGHYRDIEAPSIRELWATSRPPNPSYMKPTSPSLFPLKNLHGRAARLPALRRRRSPLPPARPLVSGEHGDLRTPSYVPSFFS